ncbi:MAG: GC-type dockerin domain-anchored protein [Planctomycetota bacterium]
MAVGDDASLIGLSRPHTCAVCVFAGLSDCNENDTLDLCDIAEGSSPDANGNGIPDDCECLPDFDGDGAVGVTDFLLLLAAWGPNPGHPADLDGDGAVGITDFLLLLAAWGPCP